MNEYALLAEDGEILNVITTGRTLAELRLTYPMYTVRPLASLPLPVRERYRHWGERP